LIAALVGGAILVALTVVNPLVWAAVVAYHATLIWLAGADARRLPAAGGFEARRQVPRPFSLGAAEMVRVTVDHAAAAGLAAEVADNPPLDLRPAPLVTRGSFDAGGRLEFTYTTRAPRRGLYAFGSVDVRCWRAGGWFLRQVRIPLAEQAAVYPNVVAIRQYQLTVRRGLEAMAGQRRMRPPGAATSFASLRDYLPGDDVRRISWKATARRDRPMTAEMEAERGQQVMLAIDTGRLMTAPAGELTKLDYAINAALLLAWVAQAHGDRVGLMTFSDGVRSFVAPQSGPAQTALINQVLFNVRPEYLEPDFVGAFAHLAQRVSRRSLVIVLTDVLDPEASRELVAAALRLRNRHLVLVVAMGDPAVLAARSAPIETSQRAYEWAAAEELLAARRQSFEALRRGGALALDVPAGRLSPSLVERYLELKERALL
jgi:uncharacterized protein (DUF58 family)